MVYWTDFPYNSLNTAYNKSYTWDRVRNRISNATLFGSGITPNGVFQGQVGDCYFLASCSAAAEYPARIQQSFVTQNYTAEGIIVVRALVLGRPTDIYVDDYLPFYNWTTPKNFLFFAANGTDGGMWSVFLEKVWAKASGNYEIIEGGWSAEVLRFLTGAPTVSYYKNYNWMNATQAWDICKSADLSKYIMMAATPGTSDKDVISIGIAASHAYTLLNAFTVKFSNGTEKAKLF